jgi:hypothetical protein
MTSDVLSPVRARMRFAGCVEVSAVRITTIPQRVMLRYPEASAREDWDSTPRADPSGYLRMTFSGESVHWSDGRRSALRTAQRRIWAIPEISTAFPRDGVARCASRLTVAQLRMREGGISCALIRRPPSLTFQSRIENRMGSLVQTNPTACLRAVSNPPLDAATRETESARGQRAIRTNEPKRNLLPKRVSRV